MFNFLLTKTKKIDFSTNQRHATARSIGALARSIQLPSTLVDLRHEITHAAEPPTLKYFYFQYDFKMLNLIVLFFLTCV
jgi:hypothetical protein